MSVQNPLRLLNLAGKTLLTNEALAISALEYLPIELFPRLFMEAFYGRHRKTLKALVQAWPFVRLPLGGLMQTPHVVTLQAVLEGLGILLTRKDRPSSSMVPMAEDGSRIEKPLVPFEVFTELHLKERTMSEFLTYLLKWVEQRDPFIHLYCKKLKMVSFPMDNIMKVLSMVQLDCIQELHVNCTWHLSTLAMIAPLLGQMSNVQKLFVSHTHLPDPEEWNEQHTVKITSQFLRLHHLQDLHLESRLYLEGCLDQMLRCLMNPLDNLSIIHCLLTDSDLTHLSQSPNISQLKSLNLSGATMTYSSPELLPSLLEKVSATLQELYLEQSGIRDSHLEAILPALSHCFQLTSFSTHGNLLSMPIMEKMLRHISELPSLGRELYTDPQESFSSLGILQPGRLAQCRAELLEILKDLGCPRTIWICFTPCPHHGDNTFYHPEPIIYGSNIPG
ncbi:melanoma antigen preferentially expressed in tumors-like [Dama dama]|uniref:melanoma antigen preferentially expressed in tumors-like n=1 Tax=Dama dama TaxID=30532 RepID=UPI002A360279|nr:melanoma antigen preferentially expressed in tumors-like [Dama dama]